MRKVFPVIVLLITLSVAGIMYIQIQWIQNAITLKKDQYSRDLTSSMLRIRQNSYDKFLEKRQVRNAPSNFKDYVIARHYTAQIFTRDEMKGIIDSNLKENGIRQPFEFAVTDFLGFPVMQSGGFAESYNQSIPIVLTPPQSALRETLYILIKDPQTYFLRKMIGMIVASIIFTCIIIAAFALTVRTMFRQKKLSEIKSDFINNMTHELKTPLATISLAVDALNNPKVICNEPQIKFYSGIIKDENKRMNKQVEKILQSARLERQEVTLNITDVDIHELIRKAAENFSLQVQEKHGVLFLRLNASRSVIKADELHVSNVIVNLIDNAIKYSKDSPRIEIDTFLAGNGVALKVRDNGIGMNKETQARIFEKFYRAHTGNLHNVKGFGLGLNYVKAMVEAHNGRIKVDSAPGKGSAFTIIFPFKNKASS